MHKTVFALVMAAVFMVGPAVAQQDGIPLLDHVFVIMMENHAYKQIIGNSNAPFINYLATRYALATNYSAVSHPSLPNYLATIAGDYFQVADDASATVNVPPGPWSFNAPTVGSQLEEIGKDWRDYQEDLPEAGSVVANWPGDSNTGALYAVKHNPFPYFQVHQSAAELHKMVPLSQLDSDLAGTQAPALAYIVPNQCNDMHGLNNPLSPCTGYSDDELVARGDRQIEWLVQTIINSNTWQRGRNALFVVWDEGNGAPLLDPVVAIAVTNFNNCVKGVQDHTPYTHYSLLKTIEAGFQLPYLGHAADSTTKTMAPMLTPAASMQHPVCWTTVGVGDFNGDGTADILWRHTSGVVYVWLLNETSIIGQGSPGSASTDWTIVGVGDFNGDGTADILWRHTSGVVYVWLLNGTSIIGQGVVGSAGIDWTIVDVGDFNGDHNMDILWRHTSGVVYVWLLNGTSVIGQGSPGSAGTDWAVVDVGDFNGDHNVDILWRHTSGVVYVWLLNGTSVIGQGSPGSAGTDWAVVGVGDYNGDGRADILWRHTSGGLYEWWLNGTSVIGQGSPGSAGTDWAVVGVGDYNGDGTADILWRHTSGVVYEWWLNGTSVIGGGSPGSAGTDWQLQ